MNCDELQQFHDPYLDSELDARTTLEIEQHLATCPHCARAFAEEEKLEGRITAGLRRGQRTSVLWEPIERSIASSAPAVSRPDLAAGPFQPGKRGEGFLMLARRLYRSSLPSPKAWAGLAAVWAIILTLNFTSRDAGTTAMAINQTPSASEMRFALHQKQLLMTDLAFAPQPADKPEPVSPGPRSDRRDETRNA